MSVSNGKYNGRQMFIYPLYCNIIWCLFQIAREVDSYVGIGALIISSVGRIIEFQGWRESLGK